jgi:hypothetical protein
MPLRCLGDIHLPFDLEVKCSDFTGVSRYAIMAQKEVEISRNESVPIFEAEFARQTAALIFFDYFRSAVSDWTDHLVHLWQENH